MKTPTQIIAELVKAGYSQEKIAKGAKLSQMTISRWMRATPKNIAGLNRLEKFAKKVLK